MSRAFGLLGIALGAIGCAGGPPKPGDTLRLALINDPILNPVLTPDIGSVLVNKVLFPGLVRPDTALHVEADLATTWEVSPDGRSYVFHLRPGVTWHDGRPFTAGDVKFTFDQILDPASGSLQWSDFSVIDSVTVIDSLSVRFTLASRFAPFLTLLGHNAGIIPEHAFRTRRIAEAIDFNRSRPIGTGPFRVVESAPGSYLVLEVNPTYYGPRPRMGRIVFKIVPDVNVQVAQIRAGELDLVVLEPANLHGLEREPGLTVEQVAVPQHYFVGFNQDLARFKSATVRRALMLAVNRQAIIDGVLKGYGDYPRGTIPVVLGDYYADTLPIVRYDTAEALRLLDSVGWRRGAGGLLRDAAGTPFRVVMLIDKGNPSREQTAVAVQQDLRRIGIDLELRTLEFAAMVRDYVQPRRFEAYLVWWNTPLDPDQFSYYGSGQANNSVGYRNRSADSLLALGRATLEPALRRSAYHAYQAVEAADPPVLVLYYPREIRVRRSTLMGFPRLGIRDALRHTEKLFFGREGS